MSLFPGLHLLAHVLGFDYGLPYGNFSWYNMWSGVGGSFLVSLIGFAVVWWLHQTCSYSWRCFRKGRHEAAGGTFQLCWKHHPDMGVRPHHELIHQLHSEWKARQ